MEGLPRALTVHFIFNVVDIKFLIVIDQVINVQVCQFGLALDSLLYI